MSFFFRTPLESMLNLTGVRRGGGGGSSFPSLERDHTYNISICCVAINFTNTSVFEYNIKCCSECTRSGFQIFLGDMSLDPLGWAGLQVIPPYPQPLPSKDIFSCHGDGILVWSSIKISNIWMCMPHALLPAKGRSNNHTANAGTYSFMLHHKSDDRVLRFILSS